MKLLIAVPAEGSVPLLEFFGLLDEKQRQMPPASIRGKP